MWESIGKLKTFSVSVQPHSSGGARGLARFLRGKVSLTKTPTSPLPLQCCH